MASTATKPNPTNPALPTVPGMPITTPGTTVGQLSQVIPGLPGLTQSATDVIGNMLKGQPSPSATQTANAYFGVGAGVPGSEFIRNRGFDIYGQQAQQRQQQGLQDLSGFLGTYSPMVATPGEIMSNQLGYAQLGQSGAEFNASQAFNDWLQQQRLGLDWANLASSFAR
jgi:hypothetical protein